MPEIDTIVIMGNGPSLRGVDLRVFDGVHTFGMKNAHRLFRQTGWWPTYYGCFDEVSMQAQSQTYKELIEDPKVTVRRFFLLAKVSDSPRCCHLRFACGGERGLGASLDDFRDGGNTAVNCAQVAVCLGYRRMLLIGVDCKWKNAPTALGTYVVSDPAESSDYFFDGYKRKGEVYNAPCPGYFHLPAWSAFAKYAEEHGVAVVNCSQISMLECFPKSTLEAELARPPEG